MPEQLPKRLDELSPIFELHNRLELVEIVIDRSLDRRTHLHDLPDMRLDMALRIAHRLHPELVVLLYQLQLVDYRDGLGELEGSDLLQESQVLGVYLGVVEVGALVDAGGVGLHELDDEGAVVAVSEAADLAGRVQSLTQSLPLPKMFLLMIRAQLLKGLLDEQRHEVQRRF